ncbi:Uncharacterised protein [Chlamydia trachomatis]|nr:Uncharacterised protein [Chlamydia trachomatis]
MGKLAELVTPRIGCLRDRCCNESVYGSMGQTCLLVWSIYPVSINRWTYRDWDYPLYLDYSDNLIATFPNPDEVITADARVAT